MLNRCTCLLWLVALFVLAAVPEHAKAGVAEVLLSNNIGKYFRNNVLRSTFTRIYTTTFRNIWTMMRTTVATATKLKAPMSHVTADLISIIVYLINSNMTNSIPVTCQNCILDVHCTNCTRKDAPEEQRRSSLITSTDKATTARTETTTTAAMTTPKHPTTTEATTTSTPPPSTAIAAQSSTETAPPTTVAATDPPTTIKDTA